ncbi:MAG: hypothetical protein COY58_00765 [Gammaproteobacteria bacterium CG_4_10_14_0_8_um_filter_38_16]|nr:MAG: hypothetical protein COY58_00765 [Gammaproteobacteria bacterium CG_4_10_14_0_8_um_filter_38_16]PJA04329.1 MAG: hypothetical protein COX72_00695 [Gammaproteobacteria bacterium CG_4_10_14_0_2_um_filter_38_22]PJB10083.1 MAG: hypothetical protein CO120_06705 [Gammaproteobacteria bacterium CG_4_9_14_3_um_filter_38_9]
MKKVSYFLIVFLVSGLIVLFYSLFMSAKPGTPDHTSLSLQPYTAREQQDLVLAQEQSEGTLNTGPLVAQMSAQAAQAKVLNLPQSTNATTSHDSVLQ